jgi:hypothetical protein
MLKGRTWRRMYRKFGDSPQIGIYSRVAAKSVSRPGVTSRAGPVVLPGLDTGLAAIFLGGES